MYCVGMLIHMELEAGLKQSGKICYKLESEVSC